MRKNILAGILAVAVIVLGYVLWKNKAETVKESNEGVVSSTRAAPTDIQYQVIPEWGLKYKVTDVNKNIYYKVEDHVSVAGVPYKTLDLYSKKLQDQQQFGEVGHNVEITRSTSDPRPNAEKEIPYDRVRKIGDYYYWNSYESQSPCPHYGANGKVDQAQDPVCGAQIDAEFQVFTSLELAN